MHCRTRFALLMPFVCAAMLLSESRAQEAPGQLGEAATLDVGFRIRSEVELITVQVSVRDRKGAPVRNLRKEDFTLYEDGKMQEILSLDEVTAEGARSPLGVNPLTGKTLHGGKTVLMLFHEAEGPLRRDAAVKFVQEHMRPGDLFAVAVYGTSMSVLQNFTFDKAEVLRALGSAKVPEKPGESMAYADLFSALDALIPSVAPIKGQKNIFLFYKNTLQGNRTTDAIEQSDDTYVAAPLRTARERKATDRLWRYYGSSEYARFLKSARQSGVVFHAFCVEVGCDNTLAGDSGGGTVYVASMASADLSKMDDQISNYYVLGFQSNTPRHDGAFRKITVKVKAKGSTVRHADGYRDRLPVDVLADTASENRLLTALASPVPSTSDASTATGDTPLALRPFYFYDSPHRVRLFVAAEIGLEGVAITRKNGDKVGVDLDVMGVAYAESGVIAARFSETVPVRFDKGAPAGEWKQKSAAYRNYFRLPPGRYRLKLAVSDGQRVLGVEETSVEVPRLPERGPAGSSLVVVERALPMPELIRDLQARLLDEDDPLVYRGSRVEPSVTNKVAVGAAIPVLFHLYNLPSSTGSEDMAATGKLVAADGRTYAGMPVSLGKAMLPGGGAEAVAGLSLAFPDAPAGRYRLVVEVAGQEAAPGNAEESVQMETDLTLAR